MCKSIFPNHSALITNIEEYTKIKNPIKNFDYRKRLAPIDQEMEDNGLKTSRDIKTVKKAIDIVRNKKYDRIQA